MRYLVSVYICIIAFMTLGGCSGLTSFGNAPGKPVVAEAPVRVVEKSAPEVPTVPETENANPCSGASGNICGEGDGSIDGLPAASIPQQIETPAGLAGYDNSATFYYSGKTVTEDTEWRGRVTIKGFLTIAPQATVTIHPGTLVQFEPSSRNESRAVLLVFGRLAAMGSKDYPVRFKPVSGGSSAVGWQGIVFLDSRKKNVLEHCEIEGAEAGVNAQYSELAVRQSRFSGCGTALRSENSLLYVRDSAADKCALGIALFDSEAQIMSVNITSNRSGIRAKRSSVYLSGSTLTANEQEAVTAQDSKVKFVKSRFERNGGGILLSSCEGEVSGNGIVKNRNNGISIDGSLVKVNSNDISHNGANGLRVADGKGIAWGNSLSFNGRYDVYNAGSEDFMAVGNWWGDSHSPDMPGRIFDRSVSGKGGRVIFYPVLDDKPDTAP